MFDKLRLFIILIPAIINFISFDILFAQKSSGVIYETIEKNLIINSYNLTQLDCTIIYPYSIKDSYKKYPCIIYCHGLGQSKEYVIQSAREYAKNGYVTFVYSMRGQGKSGGTCNLMSFEETEDLKYIVSYLKKDKKIISDKIAVIGSSQGGIISFKAACEGLDVRCIVSDLCTPDFVKNWLNNDCIKMTFLWSLNYKTEIIRYCDEIENIRKSVFENSFFINRKILNGFIAKRDFDEKINKCDVPVLVSNSWEDKFFNANYYIYNENFTTGDNKIFIGYLNGHGGNPVSEDIEFHKKYIDTWLEFWLYDIGNIIENINKFNYSYYNNNYKTIYKSNNNPFNSTKDLILYLSPDNNIYFQKQYFRGQNNKTLKNIISNSGYTLQNAVNSEFYGKEFKTNFAKDSLTFESDVLKWNYNILGIPKINIKYISDSKAFQLNFQIYEVDWKNNVRFITSINFTDWNNSVNCVTENEIHGSAISHIFHKGNKIRIVVTNLDTRPNDDFLRTNPFVLPVFINSNTQILFSENFPVLTFKLKE